jgi:transposase
MHIKTILNHVTDYKSFVFGKARWLESSDGTRLGVEVELLARKNGRMICSECGRPAPGYDRSQTPRRFEFVPLWGIAVIFVYCMRRVDCERCGVKVEQVPWAEGKNPMTNEYRWFLARWAKRMSWKQVSEAFQVSWDRVYSAVKHAVSWGLQHRDLSAIRSIGIDEIQWKRGHRYQTLVYQLDHGRRRLLWIGAERKAKTLLRFFRFLGRERSQALEFICSDMWQPYIKVIAKKANQAVHVLDRFHIVQRMNKAIDQVRAAEVKALKADGYEPVLKGARWLLLKRPENLSETEAIKLADVLQYNLKSVRAHLLTAQFQMFWMYITPLGAGIFMDSWCKRVMRSRIEPMKKVAKMLRKRRELILNWFRAEGQISAGIVEGFNNKAKLTTRKAFGLKTQEAYETALYHTLGALPEPEFAHEFL